MSDDDASRDGAARQESGGRRGYEQHVMNHTRADRDEGPDLQEENNSDEEEDVPHESIMVDAEEEDEDEEEEEEEEEDDEDEEIDEEEALETTVFQLVHDIVTTEWAEEELTTKLNMIAEALEEAEAAFRKDRTPPYRREGHLIGALLQVLEQHDEFYPILEGKLGELTETRVKAAVCRLLLATVTVNSRFVVELLSDEETLDRVCDYAADAEPPLRCYATGLLAVGLRDRSVADVVVNKEASIKFLKRIRLYASKLERERSLATKYISERLKKASMAGRKRAASVSSAAHTSSAGAITSRGNPAAAATAAAATSDGAVSSISATTTTQRTGLKRKHSETTMASTSDRAAADGDIETHQSSTQDDLLEDSALMDESSAQTAATAALLDEDKLVTVAAAGDILGFQPDSERHEEDLKRLVMLELLYTLDCIGLMGEYMELFAPALKEDVIGTIITFLHSHNSTILSHTMKLTSHFLAHKKFCFSLIDAGGVDLIFATAKTQQGCMPIGLLDRSLSMCLHGLASSNAVMEKVLSMDADSLLTVSFGLLSSPNDRARQNAVVFFGLTLSFKVVLDYFEKENGLYTLLNIIRAGNNPKSAVQRQLSHDACLCLRQYLRVHMALVTHRLRRRLSQLSHPSNRSITGTPMLTAAPALARLPVRVPKFQSSKPVDIDDKTHEQNLVFYEKYQFSVPSGSSGTNAPWSAAAGPGGAMWPPAGKLNHLRGPLVMLEVVAMMASMIQNGDPDESSGTVRLWIVERAQFCLECLRVLTLVVPSLSNEVCSTEVAVEEAAMQKVSGLSILLELAMSSNARDSSLVRDALYVFCNCVSPPHAEDCWQHPHKDIRQFALTARGMRRQTASLIQTASTGGGGASGSQAVEDDHESVMACCQRVKDDRALRPVRKLAREKNAIKVCVQLLRYKRSVQNADAIRLLATRALLGLSRDRHIAQILEKMQLGQLLSDLIRQDPVLEENADLHLRFRESALDLISLVTHRAPNAVINEAADPTVRKIEKASIVAQTPISYDPNELLRLIHDHLVSKGLTESATALVRESQLQETISGGVASTTKTPEKPRDHANANALKHASHRPRTQSDVTSATKASCSDADDVHRAAKIPRLVLGSQGPLVGDGDGKANLDLDPSAISRATSDPGLSVLAIRPVKLPHGERRKRVRQAFQTPHLFAPGAHPRLKNTSSDKATTGSPRPAALRSKATMATALGSTDATNRRSNPSRLDHIITHYLREQHRQCANPVTTVPPFKLLGSDAFHRCPDPSTLVKTPVNICSRLVERSRAGFRSGPRVFAGPYVDAGVNRYVFSRYRPYRVVGNHGSTQWGPSVARFYGDDQREMLMGSHDGQVRLMQIDSDQIVEEWTCHASSSVIADLETNEHTRMAQANRLMMTGSVALTPFGISEVAIWDVNSMESARWRFAGALSPRFNHFGDRIVALDARLGDDDHDMEGDRLVTGAVVIDLATGTPLCELKDQVQSNDYGRDTNCCFAPDDSTILTGGMLWDARLPTRALYKFDKLSNVGYGFFHPNGNEVIINSAVWDLRTFQLLRMVPALDKCTVRFNSTGSVMFAYSPHSLVDDEERRRPRAKTWFRVLDARDFRDISTVELQRPLYDLAVDSKSSLLSTVEGRYLDADSSVEDDPTCRLYEIGRKRPSEDDSDVEEGLDGSDTMDDDEFDDESDTEEQEDDNDDDDSDDEEDFGEYDDDDDDGEEDDDVDDDDDGIEFIGEPEEGDDEEEDYDSDGGDDDDEDEGSQDNYRQRRPRGGPSLSARDIQLLLELPDREYYDDYSSDDEEEDDDNRH